MRRSRRSPRGAGWPQGRGPHRLSRLPLLLELPQLHPPDLPASRLRQLTDELDLARVLVGRGHALAVLLQLRGELVRALVAGPEDAERLHDLPAVGIRLPDDCG